MAVIIRALFLCHRHFHRVAFKHLIIPSISIISLLETLHLQWSLIPCKLLLPLSFLFALHEDIHLLRIDYILLHDVVGGVIIVNGLVCLLFIIDEVDLLGRTGGDGPFRLIFDEGFTHLRILAMRRYA